MKSKWIPKSGKSKGSWDKKYIKIVATMEVIKEVNRGP